MSVVAIRSAVNPCAWSTMLRSPASLQSSKLPPISDDLCKMISEISTQRIFWDKKPSVTLCFLPRSWGMRAKTSQIAAMSLLRTPHHCASHQKISWRLSCKRLLVCCCWYFSFVFCLLTDICYHAKQVFLCKRTCPVCVSPSSLLRTQMSSMIKNPVNFWKETDGCPTRT